MTTKTVRKIIHIDEEKCNGCGACAIKCAEGALKIIDGKARLISETYCDGLGACLGECPQRAITIEERPAVEFSEEAVAQHLKTAEKTIPCGCSSAVVQEFEHKEPAATPARGAVKSSLGHWPVQLTLIPPQAPFPERCRHRAGSRLCPLCLSPSARGLFSRTCGFSCLSQAG